MPTDQLWFWTEPWQAREREVDAHVAADEVQTHESADDFAAHLDALVDEGRARTPGASGAPGEVPQARSALRRRG